MDSFLLIGQSNMAGRGFLDEAHEIDTSRIFTLRNGRWVKMFRPINPDRHFSGVSLAESFAEQYAKKYNVDVGLISCADGGTALSQWMPGEILFDNAVYQAKLAQRTSRIVGVLWHQGESDCPEELCSTYQARFELMMHTLQKELGLSNVPFVLGGLGDFLALYPLPNYTGVNKVLQNIASSNEMTSFASAEGLGANPDNLHFNAASLYEFGLRYFKEYERLREKVNLSADEDLPASDTTRSAMELL